MNITVDRQANVAYIRLCERRGAVETIRVTDDFLVDVDESGAVCGLELLSARDQLIAAVAGKLQIVEYSLD